MKKYICFFIVLIFLLGMISCGGPMPETPSVPVTPTQAPETAPSTESTPVESPTTPVDPPVDPVDPPITSELVGVDYRFTMQRIYTNGKLSQKACMIQSMDELSCFYQTYKDSIQPETGDFGFSFLNAVEKYNDAYFSENILIIFMEETCSSLLRPISMIKSVTEDQTAYYHLYLDNVPDDLDASVTDDEIFHIILAELARPADLTVSDTVHLHYGDYTTDNGHPVFSTFLHTAGFFPELSQKDFLSLMAGYRYGGEAITDILIGCHYDGESGGGYQASDTLFGFFHDYSAKEDEKTATITTNFYTHTALDGFFMPCGITFDDTLTLALDRLGLQFDPSADFIADEGSDVEMTLGKNASYGLTFRDLKRSKEPIDYKAPYEICFTETYTTTLSGWKTATLTRSITLSFDDQALYGAEITTRMTYPI